MEPTTPEKSPARMSWLTVSSLICSWLGIAAECRSKSLLGRTISSIAHRQAPPANAQYHIHLATRTACVFLAAALLLLVFARSRERTPAFPVAVASLILGLLWMLVLG